MGLSPNPTEDSQALTTEVVESIATEVFGSVSGIVDENLLNGTSFRFDVIVNGQKANLALYNSGVLLDAWNAVLNGKSPQITGVATPLDALTQLKPLLEAHFQA